MRRGHLGFLRRFYPLSPRRSGRTSTHHPDELHRSGVVLSCLRIRNGPNTPISSLSTSTARPRVEAMTAAPAKRRSTLSPPLPPRAASSLPRGRGQDHRAFCHLRPPRGLAVKDGLKYALVSIDADRARLVFSDETLTSTNMVRRCWRGECLIAVCRRGIGRSPAWLGFAETRSLPLSWWMDQ